MVEPVVVEFTVAGPPEHAFGVWTEQFGRWWPADHTVSGDPAEVVLEARLGGRIWERTSEGVEHQWGTVTQWDPPELLAYDWHLGTDRPEATQVEITFSPADEPGHTKVTVTHHGWDQFGPASGERRNANLAGWNSLLPHFVAACGPRQQRVHHC